MTFSLEDVHIKMWRFISISGTNSFLIFSVYWWFGRTKTLAAGN